MGLEAVLSNLDSILSVKEESGTSRHAVVDRRKDVLMIAEEIRDNINKKTKPRAHRAFPGLKRDILHKLNPSNLVQWVQEKIISQNSKSYGFARRLMIMGFGLNNIAH